MAIYKFTHNLDADIPPMAEGWRDNDRDRLENTAMPDTRRAELDALAKEADERIKKENNKQPSAKKSFLRAAGTAFKFLLDNTLVPTAKLTNYAFKEILSHGITATIVIGLFTSPQLREDVAQHFQQASRTYSALIHQSPRPPIRPDNLGAPTRPIARPTR